MNKNLAQVREENEGAFTLIELLVVILIIGILAAIAIPAFLNQRKAAVDASVTSDVKNAATQVETWMVSNNATPVPSLTVADGTASTGDGALADIKVSDGTTLVITPGAQIGTYTIVGTNEGGNESVDDPATADVTEGITFDSTDGGLN